VIDGEVVVLREDGRSDFNALRGKQRNDAAVLLAFDLIECKGLRDLRRRPVSSSSIISPTTASLCSGTRV